MDTIIVGPEYRESFEQVLNLASAGVIKGVSVEQENKCIISDNMSFVCPSLNRRKSETMSAQQNVEFGEKDSQAFSFTQEGSSWFKRLRSNDIKEDDVSIWLSFIDKVATQYHQEYSLLEFKQKSGDANSQEKIDKEKALIKRVFSFFYPQYKSAKVVKGEEKDRIQDVYCVSFRMLVYNSGEAKPILAKVYFRNEDNKMMPLNKAEAIGVNEHLCSQGAVQTDNATEVGATTVDSNAIIDSTLGALDALANATIGGHYNFTDYIIYSNTKDEEAVRKLLANSYAEDVELTCKSVKVLYIAHVKWLSTVYNIINDGDILMKVKLGLNSSITMICAKCNGIIISSNTITSRLDNEDIKVTIDPTVPKDNNSFGLDEKDFQILKRMIDEGEISRHLMCLECEKGYGRGKCSRIVCSDYLEKTVVDGQNEYLCKDCPFPEVIYEISGNRRRHITTLGFARDVMDLEECEKLIKCECCGRMFSSNANLSDNRLCKFCNVAEQLAEGQRDWPAARQLYKRYANMLPLHKRFLHLFSKKYCIEDVDIISFILGSDIYIFDKLLISEVGFISSPRQARLGRR